MECSVCEINKDNVLSFSPYLPEDGINGIVSYDTGGIGLLNEENKSCGALFYRVNEEENSVFLESVCVDEYCRRQGLGKKLVRHLMEETVAATADHVVAPITPDKQDIGRAFFSASGFSEFIDGEWFFEIDYKMLHDWFESKIGKQIKRNLKKDKITISSMQDLSKSDVQKLPKMEFDRDISFYLNKDIKNGYILASRTGQNDIMINQIYIPGKNMISGGVMLYMAFGVYLKHISKDGILRILCATDATKGFWQKIIPNAKYRYMLYAKKSRDVEDTNKTIQRSAFSIPRINTIGKMLDDGGYTYTIEYDNVLDNAIIIERGEEKRPIIIKSVMKDNEANMFETEIYSVFSYSSLNEEEKEKLSMLKDNEGICKVIFSEKENLAMLNFKMVEFETLTDEESFLGILSAFEHEVDLFEKSEQPGDYKLVETIYGEKINE